MNDKHKREEQSQSPFMRRSGELSKENKIVHAFFGRKGGASSGEFASLNCGPLSGDVAENVYRNRMIAMDTLHKSFEEDSEPRLITAKQMHSNKFVVITNESQLNDTHEADAFITSLPHITLGVLTADCVPLLCFGENTNTPVIAAIHAGWKGAFNGIVKNVINQMSSMGVDVEGIKVAIGPCIRQSSYQVGSDFRHTFVKQDAHHESLFKPCRENPEAYRFDLVGYVTRQLEKLGVNTIDDARDDTFAQPEAFFSYRRTTQEGAREFGRNLSVISLK